eukprot:CAMPEP_0201555348 /NCGR_PEP_ID=MMETSP0173_2-20130828/48182_1 /ASSEMBLY_ACC=CAM_ASM_000268 /TAXON_ID=218659 /ORGANISM="Vexillifera sp., Strain DIVA3 564/2" /LENGTH=452 /DNA_ID=CAMNT_0047967089 /DNA_START=197 /DNA_END=1552 /DNA_ORIENTATION=-
MIIFNCKHVTRTDLPTFRQQSSVARLVEKNQQSLHFCPQDQQIQQERCSTSLILKHDRRLTITFLPLPHMLSRFLDVFASTGRHTLEVVLMIVLQTLQALGEISWFVKRSLGSAFLPNDIILIPRSTSHLLVRYRTAYAISFRFLHPHKITVSDACLLILPPVAASSSSGSFVYLHNFLTPLRYLDEFFRCVVKPMNDGSQFANADCNDSPSLSRGEYTIYLDVFHEVLPWLFQFIACQDLFKQTASMLVTNPHQESVSYKDCAIRLPKRELEICLGPVSNASSRDASSSTNASLTNNDLEQQSFSKITLRSLQPPPRQRRSSQYEPEDIMIRYFEAFVAVPPYLKEAMQSFLTVMRCEQVVANHFVVLFKNQLNTYNNDKEKIQFQLLLVQPPSMHASVPPTGAAAIFQTSTHCHCTLRVSAPKKSVARDYRLCFPRESAASGNVGAVYAW